MTDRKINDLATLRACAERLVSRAVADLPERTRAELLARIEGGEVELGLRVTLAPFRVEAFAQAGEQRFAVAIHDGDPQ